MTFLAPFFLEHYRVAALDLEIRGAGNMLGAEQSGHITTVGFGLYCQLLQRTVLGKHRQRRRHGARQHRRHCHCKGRRCGNRTKWR